MKNLYPLQLIVILLLLFFNSSAQTGSNLGGKQLLKNFQYQQNAGGRMDYYVYYPTDFDLFPEDRPVLISIHGGAERAGSPTKVIGAEGSGSIAQRINSGASYPIMVFSPHQQSFIGGVYNATWNIQLLKEFVEHIKSSYSIDENRIYLTGFSNGAQAAWQYVVDYPEDIAAYVALAGRTDLTAQTFNVNLQQSQYACRLNQLPIQVWHGTSDNIIHISHSQNMVNAINQCVPNPNPAVQFRPISGMNHGDLRPFVYSNVHGTDNIFDWMMQYTKGQSAVDLIPPVFVDNTPELTSLSDDRFSLRVNVSERARVYYAVYSNDFTPSINNIKQGTGASLVTYGSSLNSRNHLLTVSDLQPSSNYFVWLVAEDYAIPANTQATPTRLAITTEAEYIDLFAPVFIELPQVANINAGDVAVNMKLDEEASIYWAVYKNEQNLTPLQVMNGESALQKGMVIGDTSLLSLSIGSLMKNTTYSIAIVAADYQPVSNVQEEVTWVTTTTLAQSLGLNPTVVYRLNVTSTGFQSGLTDWNDLNFSGINGTRVFNNLKSTTGQIATFSFEAYSSVNASSINTVSDNGINYGAGIYPASVMRHTAYTTGTGRMAFKNLDPAKLYKLAVLGSRSGSGSRLTRFTVGTQSADLECMGNKNNILQFEALSPNSNRELAIEFTKVNSSWGYLNALVLEEYVEEAGDTIAPSPSGGFLLQYDDTEAIVSLSWQSSLAEDLAGYLIYRSATTNQVGDVQANLIAQSETSAFIDTTVEAGQEYVYWVRVLDVYGNYSHTSSPVTISIPAENVYVVNPPQVVQAVVDSASVTLLWTPSVDETEKGYIVRKTNLQELALAIDTVDYPNTNYVDTQVSYGEAYRYYVSAFDSLGNESPEKPTVLVQLPELILTPNVPSNLGVESESDSSIYLSWEYELSSGWSHFKVYVWYESHNDTAVATLTIDSLTNTELQLYLPYSETAYYFSVSALNRNGEESRLSNLLQHTTPDWVVPQPPTFLSVEVMPFSIIVSWQPSSSADVQHYRLYRTEDATASILASSFLAELTVDSLVFEDTNIQENTIYYYKLVALDSVGNYSAVSTSIGITTLDFTPPQAPQLVDVTYADHRVALSWEINTESDFSEYEIWKISPSFSDTLLIGFATEGQFVDSSVVVGETYSYAVRSLDELGNISEFSPFVSITIPEVLPEPTPTPQYGEVIKINATKSVFPVNVPGWNDVFFDVPLRSSATYSLRDTTGVLTNKTITIYNGQEGSAISDVSDNGTALNAGVFPNEVMRYTVFTTNLAKFSIGGLNTNLTYDVYFHSGRSGSGSRLTQFELNGEIRQIESINNKSNLLLFEDVNSNAEGVINVTFSRLNSSWAYLNGIVIREKGATPSARMASDNGAENDAAFTNLALYPNPSKGSFTIESTVQWNGGSVLKLTTLSGVTVLEQVLNSGNKQKLTLDLTVGVYVLQLLDNNTLITRQLIISE